MADRVHPAPPPPPDQQQAAEEATPLRQHPSFHRPPAPGTYVVHVPKDQVLRVPPPDRARRYKNLAARPARRRRLRRACCLTCAAALVLVLLSAAAFAAAAFLVFRPRAPAFSVDSLSFRDGDGVASPSPPSSSSPDDLVVITAAVRADNRANKKVSIDYLHGGEVAVAYAGGARLAAGAWPAFRQPPRNLTVLPALPMRGATLLTDEQRSRPLTVEATVPVRMRFGNVLRTWTVDVKATCEVTTTVDGRTAGTTSVTNRGCRVRVKPLWWWW